MPIFQEDPDDPFLPTSSVKKISYHDYSTQNRSPESVADFSHVPVPPLFDWKMTEILPSEVLPSNEAGGAVTSDRAELIERIKRGESPTWVPKQPVRKRR